MAVYTHISRDELDAFLEGYDLGAAVSFEGIEEGVSNTNYNLRTEVGHFVLTIYEPHRVAADDIPFFLSYAQHLQSKGIPCPQMMKTKKDSYVRTIAGKPAAIASFLQGLPKAPHNTTPEICHQVGAMQARMHGAASDFKMAQPNRYGPARWKAWVEDMGSKLDTIEPGLHDLTKQELQVIKQRWPEDLPSGAIHADLFDDNILFLGDTISGVIDFHFVSSDFFAYDLAIAMNAWCYFGEKDMQEACSEAMIAGYESLRPLQENEWQSLPILMRGVALRFMLSRAEELFNHKPESQMVPKDPKIYVERLRMFQKADMLQTA